MVQYLHFCHRIIFLKYYSGPTSQLKKQINMMLKFWYRESYTGDKKLRYYGRIEEIWELNYSGEKVPMFRVRWARMSTVQKEDKYFTTMVIPEAGNSSSANVTAQNEPWVLAKHVSQCFFITDPSRPSRVVVRRGKRNIVGMDGVANKDEFDMFEIGRAHV